MLDLIITYAPLIETWVYVLCITIVINITLSFLGDDGLPLAAMVLLVGGSVAAVLGKILTSFFPHLATVATLWVANGLLSFFVVYEFKSPPDNIPLLSRLYSLFFITLLGPIMPLFFIGPLSKRFFNWLLSSSEIYSTTKDQIHFHRIATRRRDDYSAFRDEAKGLDDESFTERAKRVVK